MAINYEILSKPSKAGVGSISSVTLGTGDTSFSYTPIDTNYVISNWELHNNEYQQLEYIESTGSQYIKLGDKFKPLSTRTPNNGEEGIIYKYSFDFEMTEMPPEKTKGSTTVTRRSPGAYFFGVGKGSAGYSNYDGMTRRNGTFLNIAPNGTLRGTTGDMTTYDDDILKNRLYWVEPGDYTNSNPVRRSIPEHHINPGEKHHIDYINSLACNDDIDFNYGGLNCTIYYAANLDHLVEKRFFCPCAGNSGLMNGFTGTHAWSSINEQYIFCRNYDNSPNGYIKMKLYNMDIDLNFNKNGEHVKVKFIPVKRKADGAIGLLDSYTNTFYANSGTDPFIAGPVINEYAICELSNELTIEVLGTDYDLYCKVFDKTLIPDYDTPYTPPGSASGECIIKQRNNFISLDESKIIIYKSHGAPYGLKTGTFVAERAGYAYAFAWSRKNTAETTSNSGNYWTFFKNGSCYYFYRQVPRGPGVNDNPQNTFRQTPIVPFEKGDFISFKGPVDPADGNGRNTGILFICYM